MCVYCGIDISVLLSFSHVILLRNSFLMRLMRFGPFVRPSVVLGRTRFSRFFFKYAVASFSFISFALLLLRGSCFLVAGEMASGVVFGSASL